MKTPILNLVSVWTLLLLLNAQAQTPTFTYQGRLDGTNGPVTGSVNLTFRLYDVASGGAQLWQESTNSVPVANGLFAVELGTTTPLNGAILDGNDRWLEIVVNGVVLANRQKLTHGPYAIRSRESATANVAATATTVASGGVSTASLQDNAVTSSKITDGSITASDVNAATFSNTFWKVEGNAGTLAGTHFLGTTDNQALELKANNARVLRVEPTPSSPNLIGGYSGNSVALGMDAAVIAGGGRSNAINHAGAELTFIGGGWANTNSGGGATLGGGFFNRIEPGAYDGVLTGGRENRIGTNAIRATIGGGYYNIISNEAAFATVSGGGANLAGALSSTVSGGYQNAAIGTDATVGGGYLNTASGYRSAIGGGAFNQVDSNANYAVVPGGFANRADGAFSLAAGQSAWALHEGTFVWSGYPGGFTSTSSNQFLIGAANGVGINTNDPAGAALNIAGEVRGATFTGNGAGLTSLNASQLDTGTVPSAVLDNAWKLGGNLGVIPGAHFLGTADNQPLEMRVRNMRAFRLEPDPSGSPNVIGGSSQNSALAGVRGVAIGGGDQNTVGSSFAGIGGGYLNSIGTNAAHGTISGGNVNSIANNSLRSALGGGEGNTINAPDSTIPGGVSNEIQENAQGGTIGGGFDNGIGPNSPGSVVSGGFSNAIGEFNWSSSIGGGRLNSIRVEADFSAIGGGYLNLIGSNAEYNVIGGGFANSIQTNAAYAAITGGRQNWIDHNADYGAIGGGQLNTVESNAQYSVIGGGTRNQIRTNVFYGFIGSGVQNQMAGGGSVIAGGQLNIVQTNAVLGVIVGGAFNEIEAAAKIAFIGGGQQNQIGRDADYAFVGGGAFNVVSSNGQYGVVGGGYLNIVEENALYATVPGGSGNVAKGVASFAAGYQARAQHDGSWVWADYQPALGSFDSATSNQFNVRASGGARFETGGAGVTVDGKSVFTGTDGSGLTSLNASQLTSGTIPDARLSANVALLNASQTFSGVNVFGANVGIGKSSPAWTLDVEGSQAVGRFVSTNATFGSVIELRNKTTGGGTILGAINFNNSAETYPGQIAYSEANAMTFRVANTERMRIDASGRMGIGRTPAVNALEVNGDASKTTAGSWLANSDARIKTDVVPVTGALQKLEQVRLVSFRYTDDYRDKHASVEDRRYLNVVAQEFQKVFPDHVKSSGEHLPDGSEILQVDTYPLTIYSAAAIQELNDKVEGGNQRAEGRIQKLEAENAELKRELQELKQLVGSLANQLNGGAK